VLFIKKLFFIISIIFINNSNGAVPTIEGLFRNGGNPNWENQVVMFSFMVEKVILKEELEQPPEEDPEKPIEESSENNIYCKIYISKNEFDYSFLQIKYNNISMKNENITKIKFYPELIKSIDADIELTRKAFYSLMLMFYQNDSMLVSKLLKEFNTDYQNNQELVNQSKWELLTRYRDFLEEKKENPDQELVSPLVVEENYPEDELTPQEILGQHNYINAGKVKLSKIEKKFYWVFNLENMGGMFSNEGQLLNQFSINYTGKKVIFNFEDYILFDSKHKLPRLLNISLDDNSSFKIRTLSVKSFNVKPNYFKKKRKKVYQQLQKNKNQESKPIMIAPFLF
jgi:hypothetical protein